RPAPAPSPLQFMPSEARADLAPLLDTANIGEREYELVRSFLQRRATLDPAARASLAAQLAGRLRTRVGGQDALDQPDEIFLEALAQSYRSRFSADRGSPPRPDL